MILSERVYNQPRRKEYLTRLMAEGRVDIKVFHVSPIRKISERFIFKRSLFAGQSAAFEGNPWQVLRHGQRGFRGHFQLVQRLLQDHGWSRDGHDVIQGVESQIKIEV